MENMVRTLNLKSQEMQAQVLLLPLTQPYCMTLRTTFPQTASQISYRFRVNIRKLEQVSTVCSIPGILGFYNELKQEACFLMCDKP